MPLLNTIGALSIEQGGDDNNIIVPPITDYFFRIVPNHDGNTFIVKLVNRFQIYEYNQTTNNYDLTFEVLNPFVSPNRSIGLRVLTEGCDINKDGTKFIVAFSEGNWPLGSRLFAYEKTTSWELKTTVLEAGDNRFGNNISISWADNGCAVSAYQKLNYAANGSVYYYGDIWSSTRSTIRIVLQKISPSVSGVNRTYPNGTQITDAGNYIRAASFIDINGNEANLDVWSITTQASAPLPVNAKFHEASTTPNDNFTRYTLLNREFNSMIYSGDKNVSFEMKSITASIGPTSYPSTMTELKIRRNLLG